MGEHFMTNLLHFGTHSPLPGTDAYLLCMPSHTYHVTKEIQLIFLEHDNAFDMP